MEDIFRIYGLATVAEPDVIRYIGLTKRTVEKRLAAHKSMSKHLRHHAACWIRSNNREIIATVLEDNIAFEHILEKERYYIKLYKEQGADLVNGNDGGMVYTNPKAVAASKKGIPRTPETIAKIKAALAAEDPEIKRKRFEHIHATRKKPVLSEAGRKSISESSANRIVSQETRNRISVANTGRKASEETRKKLSVSHMGILQSAESIAKRVAQMYNKPQVWVVQMDAEGNIINEWGSGRIAQREAGINYKHISACINGKRKTAGGFFWKRKETLATT